MSIVKKYKIEFAGKEDLNEILELEQICFGGDSFSKAQFRYLIAKAKGEFVLIKNRGKILAYLILLKRKNSSQNRIYSIAIAPEARGQGLAKKLLDYAEKVTTRDNKRYISLEVKKENHAAINLYLHAGFKKNGIKMRYYFDGTDAILMRKEL